MWLTFNFATVTQFYYACHKRSRYKTDYQNSGAEIAVITASDMCLAPFDDSGDFVFDDSSVHCYSVPLDKSRNFNQSLASAANNAVMAADQSLSVLWNKRI